MAERQVWSILADRACKSEQDFDAWNQRGGKTRHRGIPADEEIRPGSHRSSQVGLNGKSGPGEADVLGQSHFLLWQLRLIRHKLNRQNRPA